MTEATMARVAFPRIPLKDQDAAMLAYELSRAVEETFAEKADRDLIESAAMLAAHLHRNQTRRTRRGFPRVPYIEHPLRNAIRLIRWDACAEDPIRVAEALLHDVVEDCAAEIVASYIAWVNVRSDDKAVQHDLALAWLGGSYGSRLARAVSLVSNAPGSTREDYLPHIERLCRLVTENPHDDAALDALLVKASDLMDNAGSLRHQLAAGEDEKVVRRLASKYQPVLGPVIAALRDADFDQVADALEEVQQTLTVILA